MPIFRCLSAPPGHKVVIPDLKKWSYLEMEIRKVNWEGETLLERKRCRIVQGLLHLSGRIDLRGCPSPFYYATVFPKRHSENTECL